MLQPASVRLSKPRDRSVTLGISEDNHHLMIAQHFPTGPPRASTLIRSEARIAGPVAYLTIVYHLHHLDHSRSHSRYLTHVLPRRCTLQACKVLFVPFALQCIHVPLLAYLA